MGPQDRAEDIVGRLDIRDPVAHRLVDRVLQRPAPRLDRGNLCAEQAHPNNVQGLPPHVLGSHEDLASQTKSGGHCGGRYSVLAGPRFGDDPSLAHATGEENLAKSIINLVRTRVAEILTFEVNASPSQMFRQPTREIEGRRASHIMPEKLLHLRFKARISLRIEIDLLQLRERHHQGLRNKLPSVPAEMSASIRKRALMPRLSVCRRSEEHTSELQS